MSYYIKVHFILSKTLTDPFNRHINATAVAAFIDLLFKHLKTAQLDFCHFHPVSYKVATPIYGLWCYRVWDRNS